MPRPVLNFARVRVEEERVNCDVTALSVLLRRAERLRSAAPNARTYHYRDATVPFIHFFAQVHEVQREVHDACRRSLEILALL